MNDETVDSINDMLNENLPDLQELLKSFTQTMTQKSTDKRVLVYLRESTTKDEYPAELCIKLVRRIQIRLSNCQ